MNRMQSKVTLRDAEPRDADAIAAIYNHYVTDSTATFETEPVKPTDMAGRLAKTAALGLPWLVADTGEQIAGFACASRWKERHAYRYAVESTVYVAAGDRGRGFGEPLYAELLDRLRRTSAHAVIAGIVLPNAASVRLHEKLGFRKIGHFEEVGYKFDRWIDVGYWQLLL